MCGICGIYTLSHDFLIFSDFNIFPEMLEKIRHRGPDGWGIGIYSHKNYYIQKGKTEKEFLPDFGNKEPFKLLFGHRRLSIIDLSEEGINPLSNEDDSLWIIFNGEIYNYLELKKELLGKHTFKTKTDTEVILHAFEEWGIDCFSKFNGMWSIALFDQKNNKLILSRDRFGKKPLYYWENNNKIIFSSEIKSIIVHPEVEIKYNEQSIFDYLYSGYGFTDICEETFFENINQVKPGTLIIYQNGKRKETCYWDLTKIKEQKIKEVDIIPIFREIFIDSIRLRLRSDVPVGITLSGGLDSSSILAGLKIIKKDDIKKLYSFSSWYEGKNSDEREHITTMINWSGINSYTISPCAEDMIKEINTLIYHQDEPFSGTSIFASWSIMKKIKSHNIPVIITGQGGDEILAGYDKYYAPFFALLLNKFQFIRLIQEIFYAYSMKRVSIPKDIKNMFYNFLTFHLSDSLKKLLRSPKNLPEYLNFEWANKFQIRNIFQRVFSDILNNSLYLSTVTSPLPSLLRFDDRNSMAFSIETRAPFLDYRIVEFLYSISGNLKIKKGYSKYLLRRLFDGFLPKSITWRQDKLGFPTPLKEWLKNELKDYVRDIFSSQSFKSRQFFNSNIIMKMLDDHISGKINTEFTLWTFLNLELWLRQFFK